MFYLISLIVPSLVAWAILDLGQPENRGQRFVRVIATSAAYALALVLGIVIAFSLGIYAVPDYLSRSLIGVLPFGALSLVPFAIVERVSWLFMPRRGLGWVLVVLALFMGWSLAIQAYYAPYGNMSVLRFGIDIFIPGLFPALAWVALQSPPPPSLVSTFE